MKVHNFTFRDHWVQIEPVESWYKISIYSLDYNHIVQFLVLPGTKISQWKVLINNTIDVLK